MLCTPHPEALNAIQDAGLPVVEIGAGDGVWTEALRDLGVSVRAYDINPKGHLVSFGDHTDAAGHKGLMLAVWPPDGSRIASWIKAASWPAVCIVANLLRLDFGDALSSYTKVLSMRLPEGRKGASTLTMWRANVVG